MDGGCGGGACGGGGGGRRGGGQADFRRTLRTAMVVSAVMGAFLLIVAARTQAVALWAAALLALNHAATYGVSLATMGRSLETRARLSLLQGALLAGAVVGVLVTAGRAVIGAGAPDAPLASLALLVVIGVGLSMATLLFAGRRGRLSLRSVWLCGRGDLLPQAAGMAGLAGVWALNDGWPDAAAGAVIAATLLPAAWSLARGALALTSPATGNAPRR
ncbi:hypothetical protein [Azospirillum sp.]|uniref:hypothetical protein n=1 Tax=Azospirillum sp. TaxID=34012 RepID=UPI002607A710|nr:hypothetical protein [Azospirillum sp.]